jgi:hypothetical protein
MKVPKGVDMIEALFAMEGKTAWIIDVWNCHGVFKMQDWGVGKGCEPELPEGLCWLDIGWFTIPVEKADVDTGTWEDEALRKRVEAQLFRIVERYGMINMSGWYPVTSVDLEAIKKILSRHVRKKESRLEG